MPNVRRKLVLLTSGVAAGTLAACGASAQLTQSQILIRQGAVMCANNGDLVVFANSGSLMPSCGRLAHDTPAVRLGASDHGIARVRPPVGSGDSTVYYTLDASIK